jgi:hypothetical protein
MIIQAAVVVAFAFAGEEIELFNGKDLKGWKAVFQEEKSLPDRLKGKIKYPVNVEDVWKVEDGVLVCKGQPFGYLVTEKEYIDFELSLEWKWPASGRKQGGNNGVLLFVHGPERAYPPGDNAMWPGSVEAQLAMGGAGDIWLIPPGKLEIPESQQDSKSKRRFHRTTKENVEKPIGEWNKYEIVCKGGNVSLKVNGTLVNEGKNADPKKGKIALQSEGTEIHFRNIKLKEL